MPARRLVAAALAAALLAACAGGGSPTGADAGAGLAPQRVRRQGAGIHTIQHVIMIVQENRSFDEYFGTFPGADGLPKNVCLFDPRNPKHCQRPWHDPADSNGGGPHSYVAAKGDFDYGKMDGFVRQDELAAQPKQNGCGAYVTPACKAHSYVDVMGWHDAREIPNYWQYARNYVLEDHFFNAINSWSLPAHLFEISEWSALCGNANPMSCRNAIESPGAPPDDGHPPGTPQGPNPNYSWTDITYLLHKYNVSWKYYLEGSLNNGVLNSLTPGIWSPIRWFETVAQDGQQQNIVPMDQFFEDAKNGTLPAVAWIAPNTGESEHPPSGLRAGQAYVTNLINAVMQGPDWNSSAIFVSWDDWGGFYDHVPPPVVDENGYGFRVPAFIVSPYARTGYIDHQVASFDGYLKFIEDDFLDSARLNPKTDGRPDRRPSVREALRSAGSIVRDFNFNQAPRPPMILPIYPTPGPPSRRKVR